MDLHELRDVPAEKSQVAFLPLPGSEVELVMPTTDDSGIAKYLSKRGPGMHHICLEVDDIEGMLTQLRSKRCASHQRRTAHYIGRKKIRVHSSRKYSGCAGGVVSDLITCHCELQDLQRAIVAMDDML